MIFDDEFDELAGLAYQMAFQVLGSLADAEEIAQDTMTKAYVRWRRVQHHARPWVCRVAINAALGRVRRRGRIHGSPGELGRLDSDVRSRRLESFDPATNMWTIDPRSDIGRIARQQDLIQRIYTTVLAQNYDTTDKVRLLNDVVDDLTVDNGLDLDGVRAIFNAATNIGADNFTAHNITSAVTGATVQGNSVLIADPAGVAVAVDDFLGLADVTNGSVAAPNIVTAEAVEPSASGC